MAEIQQHPPELMYDASQVCYTDGSKHGTSITAAWVHPATPAQHAVSLPICPSSPHRTSFRGGLIALHEALHSPTFPIDVPLHIMTDSLTGLHLANAHLVRPAHLRYHKHRWLIAAIAQNLLARPARVCLTKVRVHIEISRNEAADKLACEAHTAPHILPTAFQDPQLHGPAWVQCSLGDDPSELDDLRTQALQVATTSFHESQRHRQADRQTKTFLRAQTVCSNGLGIHTVSSMAFWLLLR